MDSSQLRVALISGNYNMVRDGPTQALNLLVGFLMRHGVAVRVFAPTIPNPQVEATGELISLPSFSIPGRPEYRFPLRLRGEVLRQFEEFAPNMIHLASPDFASRSAAEWGNAHGIPVVASVHTRFESYLDYYRIGFAKTYLRHLIRQVYSKCDALLVPNRSVIADLRQQRMNENFVIWQRGVDRTIFKPERRSLEWRRGLGIADQDIVIGFLGRVVREKGIDEFVDVMKTLEKRGVAHKVLVIGDGLDRDRFAAALPNAIFVGFQQGNDLGRAIASVDVMLSPSVTEVFPNVLLETMACGVPLVAAKATGPDAMVLDGTTGVRIQPGDTEAYTDAIQAYCADPALRQTHGAAALLRAQEFEWDNINRVVLDAYLELAGKAKAKACAA